MISKKIQKIDYFPFLEKEIYKSRSKIVLSGLGADEFFGGYARYRTSFNSDGILGLSKEMSKDIDRVWTRNFGRDDRVCSENGIELRFPYFDFELIDFLGQVNQLQIANFHLNRGNGEKMLLRNVVRSLGFK